MLIFPIAMFIVFTSSSVVFRCFHMISRSFLFSHTWKIMTALHNTCGVSAGVNIPGSIFQFTQAEMSLFSTETTCSDLVQIAASLRVWFLPCVERGKIRIGPQEPSFKVNGLFAFLCCCSICCFVGPAISSHSFEHTHVCIYAHTCVREHVLSCMLG